MKKADLEELAAKLAAGLPEGMKSMRGEMEKNFRSVLRSGLAKLDLVTREEFEVQEAGLAKTRAKLEVLEQRLAELESGKR
jgi:BMFP domain-containing protein YqiC